MQKKLEKNYLMFFFKCFFLFFRPAAEGQEANGNESFNGNGDHHAPSDDIKKVSEQENPLQQKYLAISQEHEQM